MMFYLRKSFKRVLAGLLSLGLLSAGVCSGQPAGSKTWKNSLGMEFVQIPAGSFTRPSEVKESTNVFGEKEHTTIPARKVTISQPFYLGKYEVTQEQWHAVMGNNPARFLGRKRPVEQVSWNDIQEFIRRLNQKEGTDKYRLPTEAEWEHAARAGTATDYFFGNDETKLGRYAWYSKNSKGQTYPVGQKQPNPWGLYDIYGNVYEWVQDYYGNYPATSVTDPRGPASGGLRVLRGGGRNSSAENLWSVYRYYSSPESRYSSGGVRLAFSPDHP